MCDQKYSTKTTYSRSIVLRASDWKEINIRIARQQHIKKKILVRWYITRVHMSVTVCKLTLLNIWKIQALVMLEQSKTLKHRQKCVAYELTLVFRKKLLQSLIYLTSTRKLLSTQIYVSLFFCATPLLLGHTIVGSRSLKIVCSLCGDFSNHDLFFFKSTSEHLFVYWRLSRFFRSFFSLLPIFLSIIFSSFLFYIFVHTLSCLFCVCLESIITSLAPAIAFGKIQDKPSLSLPPKMTE